jgi:hypothetical protein
MSARIISRDNVWGNIFDKFDLGGGKMVITFLVSEGS